MAITQSQSLISTVIVKVFQTFGLWPKPSSTPRYWLYSYFFNIFLSTLLASATIHFVLLGDISKASESLVVVPTVTAYFVKLLNFYYYRHSMKKCLQDLALFQHNSPEEIAFTTAKHKLLNFCGFMYYTCGYVTLLALSFTPFNNENLKLPMPTWYPFDWKTNRIFYGIAYVHQMIIINLILTVNVGLDLYSYYLMGMVAVQFQIIGERLRKVGNEKRLVSQSLQDLRECIIVHRETLRLIYELLARGG